eukprot:Skav230159  [mRNA]  locus=scaffold996:9102:9788:+ [translate_table: standard]
MQRISRYAFSSPEERWFRISKTLSRILRHTALTYGVHIRPDGFCPVDQVLACPPIAHFNTTLADLEPILARDSKDRFQLMDVQRMLMIRAVQGHSINVVQDSHLLQPVTPDNFPDCCVHGTYRRYFDSIKAEGLLLGGHRGHAVRNHVHFVPFNPLDQSGISGMRSDCEIAIWIDLRAALQDGVPFYWSQNGVLLSRGINGVIDTKYFTHAHDVRTKQSLPLRSECPN